jgi:hypothetical protein
MSDICLVQNVMIRRAVWTCLFWNAQTWKTGIRLPYALRRDGNRERLNISKTSKRSGPAAIHFPLLSCSRSTSSEEIQIAVIRISVGYANMTSYCGTAAARFKLFLSGKQAASEKLR